jgi:peptidoglycan-N-acetylglucosamine deacetylase
VEPSMWRTPWGDTAPWTRTLAGEYGLTLTGWTVDSHDWRGDLAPAMLTATREGLCDGAIVLAHDGIGPGAQREDARETAAYVELVSRQARSQNLQLISL